MKNYLTRSVIVLLFSGSASTLYAQAPIDIERKTADGEYMAALSLYDRLPKRIQTPLSIIAAAKSAWALGLSERALTEYDSALRTGKLSTIESARVHFAKGAIFLQNQKPQLTVLAVDEGLATLKEPSPLRGAMYVLKAQAFDLQSQHPAALEALVKAQDEVGEESLIELNYLMGRSLGRVGRYADAKEALKKIPSSHERAVDGIRELVKIADAEGDPEKAAMWVQKGRDVYPDAFLDGWYDYIMVTGAIAKDARAPGDRDELVQLRDAAVKRLAASDSWLALINAATEQHLWNRAQLKSQSVVMRSVEKTDE